MIFDFFKSKKNTEEKRENIQNKCNEIHKIWNNKDENLTTDVDGSYTGNPKNFDNPVQDADDL